MREVNLPHVVAAVEAAFRQYEEALVRHDIQVLDAYFWPHPLTVRFGMEENLYGGDAIRAYRQQCQPVHPGRLLQRTIVTTFGEDFATVSAEFTAPDTLQIGRQMQTWVRFGETPGWLIVAAHVSLVSPDRLT